MILALNASELPMDRIKLEPSHSAENVTVMISEAIKCPHERSYVNLDDATGIRDQAISERRMKKIQKATNKKAEAFNLPLRKKIAALNYLHGKNFSINNI